MNLAREAEIILFHYGCSQGDPHKLKLSIIFSIVFHFPGKLLLLLNGGDLGIPTR